MITMDLNDNLSERVHYDYPDYPIYIRHGLLSNYANYAAPGHFHDDIEFMAILSGEMEYNVDGEIVTLKKGDGIVVNARHMHFGFSSKKKESEFICILLHPMLLCSSSAFERDFVSPIINLNSMPYLKLTKETGWTEEIFKSIINIYNIRNKRTAPLKVQSEFCKIWSLIYENQKLQESLPKNNDLTIIKNMIGFIQKKYNDKINLKDIAVSGAVGQSKCCKLFNKYVNQTPNSYLISYRISKSIELLQFTDMSITEIAFEVGFQGASYYSEAFKKIMGKSPTEYRKNALKTL